MGSSLICGNLWSMFELIANTLLRFLHSEFSAELLFLWKDIDEFLKAADADEQKEKYAYLLKMC